MCDLVLASQTVVVVFFKSHFDQLREGFGSDEPRRARRLAHSGTNEADFQNSCPNLVDFCYASGSSIDNKAGAHEL